MLTAIVIDDLGSLVGALDKAQILNDISIIGETIIVSTDPAPSDFSKGVWLQRESLVDGIIDASEIAASKRILVISAALNVDTTEMSRFAAEVDVSPLVEHILMTIRTENSEVTFPAENVDGIISAIVKHDIWPTLCLATTRMALRSVVDTASETVAEYTVHALLTALANGDALRTSSMTGTLHNGLVKSLCELEDQARSRCLATAVDSMNIEELFPNHPWGDHSQESAAAAYHSLAALFLRFGDSDAAAECLACSERLEESPRYFALKGMIQHQKGEVLGAVANLVSSLQCYELRKASDGKHYLSFKPKNLEVINSRLVDGLNALNKRENDRAITHFSEAVFNFDSFYAEHGVQMLTRSR